MTTVHRTVSAVIHAFALGASGVAWAQEAPPTAASSPIEEVHITGSRIQRDGMTTPTPVT